jgi:23S rRNA (pseudouridine1915-N3)-methyltransferase
MRLRVIAVGTRMPAWVGAAFEEYARRLRGSLGVELKEIAAARRSATTPAERAMDAEGQRVLAALAPRDHVVALDERGTEYSSRELARWLEQRRRSGQDLACVIGGPDGLAPAVLARAQQRWALSRLTLPHGMVRVVLIEQLYRATTLLAGHPYHRE